MAANESLSSTRAEFTHAFNHAVPGILPAAMEALLAKANSNGISSAEQKRLVNARSLLPEKWGAIERALPVHLQQLLDRSINTAYSTFRPASSLGQVTELALLDSSTFETTLRFNEMTQNFRDKAGQALLDLNIRIAVLFGQDDIRERENPFRPYILARCIFLAVEEQQLIPDTEAILIEQLGESLAGSMSTIYQEANAALEKQGINASLSLKISKAPEKPVSRTAGSVAQQGGYSSMQAGVFPTAQGNAGAPSVATQGSFPSAPQSQLQSPAVRLEQLFQTARGKPLVAPAMQAIIPGSAAAQATSFAAPSMAHMPASIPVSLPSSAPGWLNGVTALGGVLRQAFGETSTAPGTYREKTGEAGIPFTPREAAPTAARAEVAGNSRLPAQVASSGADLIQVPAALVASHLQNIENHLRQMTQAPLPPELSVGLSKILGQMHKVMVPDSAAMKDADGEIRNLIREHKDALYSLAKDADEQMCIDLVSMLFEVMLCDEMVPFAMRTELGRLQFLILQLALKDKSLLSDGKHPARLLLNRICSVSYAAEQIGDTEHHVSEEISRIIKTLLRHDSEVPELFSRIQNRFETFVARELRTNEQSIRRTVKALGESEIRFMRFACIASVMSKAMPKVNIDMSFRSFLKSEWVRAIEVAERTDDILARRYRLLVPDLLWSVFPKTDSEERNLLSSMLPSMVGTLRHGMDLMEWEKAKQQQLLNWLAEAHAKALRAAVDSKKPAGLSLPAMHERFEQFTNQADTIEHSEVHHYEFAREYYQLAVLAELGLQAKILDKEVKKQVLPTEGVIAVDMAEQPALNPAYLERIVTGVLIELRTDKYKTRCCVRWVDPNLHDLVLSMEGDASPAILSLRVLCELLDLGKARFTEVEPLFERSIHTLLKSADAVDNVAA